MVKCALKDFRLLIGALGKAQNSVEANKLVDKFRLQPDSECEALYLENEDEGVGLLCDNGVVDSIFFHADAKHDFSAYSERITNDATFELNRQNVEQLMGTPSVVEAPYSHGEIVHGGWYRYQSHGKPSIHFSFAAGSGEVELISLLEEKSFKRHWDKKLVPDTAENDSVQPAQHRTHS